MRRIYIIAIMLALAICAGCTLSQDQVREIQDRAAQAQEMAGNAAATVEKLETALAKARAEAASVRQIVEVVGGESAAARLRDLDAQAGWIQDQLKSARETAAAAQSVAEDWKCRADNLEEGTSWLEVAGSAIGGILMLLGALRGLPNGGRLALKMTETPASRRRICEQELASLDTERITKA